MTNSVLVADTRRGKPCGDQLSQSEIMTPEELQARAQRIRGALKILYSAGEHLNSRRMKMAALDGLNAARGLV